MVTTSPVLSPNTAARLPARLAETLIGLGTAANDLSFAVAEARLREGQTTLAVVRVSEREDHPYTPPEYQMIGEWHSATLSHAEQLVAIYTHVAGTYAAHTIEAFTLVAVGDTPGTWQPYTILPSDILTMPEVFIPLIQLSDDTGTDEDRTYVHKQNADLRQVHNRLLHATTHLARREAATIFDQPDQVHDRQLTDDLDDQVPTALHEYAATAIRTLDILTATGPT